jgi:hypothetical protein
MVGLTRTTRAPSGGLYNEVIEEYAPLGPAGEKRLVLRSVTYEPDVPRTIDTSYGYYVSPSPHAGQLKWWWSTDGSWGWYVYEDSAPEAGYTTTTVYRPWRDKAFPGENWVPSGTESDVAVQATVHMLWGSGYRHCNWKASAWSRQLGLKTKLVRNPQRPKIGILIRRRDVTCGHSRFDVNNPNDQFEWYILTSASITFRDRVDFDEDHP